MAYEINININNVEELSQPEGISADAKNKEQQKSLKALGKYVASQTIQPFIQTVKSNISQNIQTVTGNSDLQKRVNFGMETIQYGLNAFSNAQAGISVVTALGGTATGGVVLGLALTAIQTGIEVINNTIQIELQQRMENYQLQQIRERSGAMFNRSRRG